VVLDIGGDRGALVVWVPPSLDGAELELRPVGSPWQGHHTAVRPRDLGVGRRFAAVFGTLVAGRYQLRIRGRDTAAVIDAEVVGGCIAEATWPSSRPGRDHNGRHPLRPGAA
jgi:hypothetical protein